MNRMLFPLIQQWVLILNILALVLASVLFAQAGYQIIDTGQNTCFDDSAVIDPPDPGEPFFWSGCPV